MIGFEVVTPGYFPEVEYDNNPEFRAYVDKYSESHKIPVKDALYHEIVKQVYSSYKYGENSRQNPAL